MADPWDVPPFPFRGDETADDTYKMVGRALSEWEYLEYTLAHLYAEMIGQPARIAAIRYYGAPTIGEKGQEGTIFRERLSGLERAAEKFFVENPHQDHEGEFSRIVDTARRLADRRNEIAHGIVRPLQVMREIHPEYVHLSDQRFEYALVPPLYTRKKLDERHRPLYIYTANELTRFAQAFFELSKEVVLLRLRFSRTRRASRAKHHTP